MANIRRVGLSVVILLGVASSPSAVAFAPCHEPEIVRSTVSLRGEPEDFQFYHRIELNRRTWGPQYVIYIPTDVALGYIYEHNGFRSIPQGLEREHWADLVPLERHTDIFQPLLDVLGRPRQRMFRLIADSIEAGSVSVWTTRGYEESVLVEHYNEGCERGRVFKDSAGVEFFRIIDSIA